MGIIWLILWIACGIWGAVDASNRDKSGCLVFFLILIGGPLGLIIWFLVRPD